MQLCKVLALQGPNVWTKYPVLEAWVDLGELDDRASNQIPGFNDRLMSWLPTMIEHRCSLGYRGGFFERLRRGTYLAHILEHVTLELQSLAGNDVSFGRARSTHQPTVYKVVVEYQEESVARECLAAARHLCLAAVFDRPFDVAAEVARLRALVQQDCLGPSTRSICQAALARGIPVRRLDGDFLVQLGYGARQRRINMATTDRTSNIGVEIAQDKELTRTLLRPAGIPVPEGQPVASAEDAWAAAGEMGVPIVVKPRDGNQGRGVATNLCTRQQVIQAYEAAKAEGSKVLVEKYVPGKDYRLLVVGGRVVAAARREPACVTGDGLHTVAELVARVNADPRRGDDHATSLSKIPLDAVALDVLADQGLTPQSEPAHGRTVLIRRNANLSTGGTAVDVTDRVHPRVAAWAVEAATIVGLDIAGIDVIAADISRPLEEQGGVIVEVNAGPGLRMHLDPSEGTPRPVGEAIVNMMFPAGEDGRIPIVAVTGVNGKTTTTRLIAHILQGHGRRVGMTTTDGIYIGGRRIDKGDCSGPQSARTVLSHPAVEAAVLETARGGILRAGLGFDRCDVAVVTNIGEGDHLGLADIETSEELARVKQCAVKAVSPEGTAVLNAADPLVAEMAPQCPGAVLFFAQDGNHPVMLRHRNSGGRVAFVRNGAVVVADAAREECVADLDRVPLTRGGRIGFQVENVLAAVAAARSLGVPTRTIRRQLETFAPGLDENPGRFNLLEVRGATVIVDYGHNVPSLATLIETIDQLPQARRTAVYSVAGDRRDADILAQGRMLGEAFDRVILYEDQYLRGRARGQIMRILREGMKDGPRVQEVLEIFGAPQAVQTALDTASADDLLLIQADTIDEIADCVRQYLRKIGATTAEPAVDPFCQAASLSEVDDEADDAFAIPVLREIPDPDCDEPG